MATAALTPFQGRDVAWLVDTKAQQHGDTPFIIWEPFSGAGQTLTYRDFAQVSKACAAGLTARGVRAGDVVALHLDNCPEFLVAWIACARIGAVSVPTNTRSTAEELAFMLDDCRAVAAITQPAFARKVQDAGNTLQWIACADHDGGEGAISPPPGMLSFSTLLSDPDACPTRAPAPASPCTILYTSGTTSRPKGVVWTHANALWIASTTSLHYGLTPRDVHPIYLPLFHTNGLGLSFLATLWSGGRLVVTPRFSASRFWDVAVRHQCTWAQMFWFALRAIAAQPDPASHSFRFWAALGDMTIVRDRWGIRTLGIYGMTETVGLCISSDLHLPGPEGAMGRSRPEWEIELRRDDGSPAAPGETGALWVRGQRGVALFSEYHNNPAATAAAFDGDGWLDTGDTARATVDGDLFFMGRIKDMLKVGGENVAAVEIESIIAMVAGVEECAVVGRRDDMLDEVPVAFVVAAAPGDALCDAINTACLQLADFKRPREVRFIDALPKGLLDKVLKTELRALADAATPELSTGGSR